MHQLQGFRLKRSPSPPRVRTLKRKVLAANPWAGGLPHLRPQMAHNATGFAVPLRVLFQNVFRVFL